EKTTKEDYCANYIEPGVTLVSDEEDIDPRDLIYTALNPSYPRFGSCQRVKGKRRLHLCDFCGKMVIDISYHYFTHETEPTFACSYCPAKIKTRSSLLAHVKTVHLKTITKTCEICGKGFVHHKTYRYHMSAHKNEGNTYECKLCARTFSHPTGYQQHFKKFHKCINKLKMSAEFRSLCMSNDLRFQMLRSMLEESAKSSKHEEIECLEVSDADIDMPDFDYLEEKDTGSSCEDLFSNQSCKRENSFAVRRIDDMGQTNANTAGDEKTTKEDYCANYIEPGVTLVSDEEDIDARDLIYTALNPTYPRVVPLMRERGKRKLHMCNICGLFVKHIPKHIINHEDDITEACPHCPVKMKQKANLMAHIRTVHLKTVMKRCEICDKGFVHHKTYRYHMVNGCIASDEALLIPLEDIVDFSVVLQDVSMVTGIDINEDNVASYAMCLECTAKLKSSVTFRNACLSNESHFQELYAVLVASVKEPCAQTIDTIELLDGSDGSEDMDPYMQEESLGEFVTSPESNEEFSQNASLIDETSHLSNSEDGEFSYSANYIQPGEILYAEEQDNKHKVDWNTSLNPPAPLPVLHLREPGKRKLLLCEICGIMVRHIPSHIDVHYPEGTYSCPHCPVKIKQRNNLQAHIKTVHLRKVMKTCNICGKGFIHHKTYRYHMLNHQGEGKTFECVDCSKTFSNSIYLRDHINRLHNPDKKIRKTHSGEAINEDNVASYAMCLECTAKLKSSITFRNACLSNESHFQELYAVLEASVKEPCAETIDEFVVSDGSEISEDMDLNALEESLANFNTCPERNEEFLQYASLIDQFDETSRLSNTQGEEFSYSANYIQPGEILYSEEQDNKH
uniref:C2H2-type domain-containing protein n=1 Tax=Anopheles minimus TaxID=112268 RepID=A0A182WG35_9DIPT